MILVVGGTGQLGRQIVDLLRAEPRPVRVLTRNPAGAGFPDGSGVEVVAGDLLERDSLVRALRGVDVVICTAQGGQGRGRTGPRGVEGSGIPHLIDAARDAALRQFVYVSTASAHPDSPSDFFRGKARVEDLLHSSGLPASILRPTHLLDTWVPMLTEPLIKKHRGMVIGKGNNPVSWVAGADVAQAAARLAGRDGDGYRADLGGPEALTLRALNQQIQERVGITPAKNTEMGPAMLQVTSRLVRPFNEVMARQMQLGALLDTRRQVVDSSAEWTRLNVTPTTVGSWLDSSLPGVVATCRR